jgi:hypothetical protein
LKNHSIRKGHDSTSLKLNIVAKCGDPKMLADAMKFSPRVEDPNTKDCALEDLELFGSTKQKLDLPPKVDCDPHQPKKMNYSIPHPNTHYAKRTCIK